MKTPLLIPVLALALVVPFSFKTPWAFTCDTTPEEVTCKLMLRLETSSLAEVRTAWKQLCGDLPFEVVALPGGCLLQTRGITVAGNSLRLQRVAEAMVAHETQVRSATLLLTRNSLHDQSGVSLSPASIQRQRMERMKNQQANLEISELILQKQYGRLSAVLAESLEKLEKLKQNEVPVPTVQRELATLLSVTSGMERFLNVSRHGLKSGHPLVALQREEENRLLTAHNIAAADAVERHGVSVRNLDHDCYHMIEKLQQFGRQIALIQDAQKQLQAGHYSMIATDAIPQNMAAPSLADYAF
jgi:hypothetical protein